MVRENDDAGDESCKSDRTGSWQPGRKDGEDFCGDLNKKDIAATVAKIAGGTLIIEEAGDLDDETGRSADDGDGVPHRRTDSDPGG